MFSVISHWAFQVSPCKFSIWFLSLISCSWQFLNKLFISFYPRLFPFKGNMLFYWVASFLKWAPFKVSTLLRWSLLRSRGRLSFAGYIHNLLVPDTTCCFFVYCRLNRTFVQSVCGNFCALARFLYDSCPVFVVGQLSQYIQLMVFTLSFYLFLFV